MDVMHNAMAFEGFRKDCRCTLRTLPSQLRSSAALFMKKKNDLATDHFLEVTVAALEVVFLTEASIVDS